MAYHEFFIEHLGQDDRVLDIGCGDGWTDYQLVFAIPELKVTGIDNNSFQIAAAKEAYGIHPNLTFKYGDANFIDLESDRFDVMILSNILEHINGRVKLLREIAALVPKILIRVPCYDRDWRVPLKDEVGADSRLDSTHEIEYTEKSFRAEIAAANLEIEILQRRWGELYAVVVRGEK